MILQRTRIRWSHWLSIGRRNVEGRVGAKRTNLLSGLGVTPARRAGCVGIFAAVGNRAEVSILAKWAAPDTFDAVSGPWE